jgi:hypothetical protein
VAGGDVCRLEQARLVLGMFVERVFVVPQMGAPFGSEAAAAAEVQLGCGTAPLGLHGLAGLRTRASCCAGAAHCQEALGGVVAGEWLHKRRWYAPTS